MLPDSSILTNMQIQGAASRTFYHLFEKKYISIRCMENRLYSDSEVAALPEIRRDHTHFREWKIRKESSRKIISYLTMKKRKLNILEIGCGNGWLSHALSRIPATNIVGLDINFTELQQAATVFNEQSNLKFVYGDIYSGALKDEIFDIILFSASIQYFRSCPKIINNCLHRLRPNGEIHIMASPFYKSGEIEAAKKRSLDYYSSLGFPEMTDYYFHHDIDELKSFRHGILYNPFSLLNRISKNKDPFYWIRIHL
jgi:ubiquinone/menaquinone biosynthesis C-methylase UbiE